MGITNWLKNKIQETGRNIQAERAYTKERKLERREQYDAGYREGQYERGLAEGAGKIVPVSRQATQQRVGGKYKYKGSKGDFFTGETSGGSWGSGFWGPQEQSQKPAMETVKISKSGGVTIHRPIQPQRSMQAQENPYDFWRLSGMPAGATGANRKKNERDYDPILG
jgi:hypothetical protein